MDAIRARLYNLEKVLIDRGLGATPQMLRDAYLDKLDCLKDWTLMTLIEVHNKMALINLCSIKLVVDTTVTLGAILV